MKSEKEILHEVALALAICQELEMNLKICISKSFELIQLCLGKRMPYHRSIEDVQNASLEKCIQVFKQITDEVELVQQLNKFKDKRNFIAHQVIEAVKDVNGDYSFYNEGMESSIKTIQEEGRNLCSLVYDQYGKILVQVDFFDTNKS